MGRGHSSRSRRAWVRSAPCGWDESSASAEQAAESLARHPDAAETLADILEQAEGNAVDLEKTPLVLGPKLTFDPGQERFVGDYSADANDYLRYKYRAPFADELPS